MDGNRKKIKKKMKTFKESNRYTKKNLCKGVFNNSDTKES